MQFDEVVVVVVVVMAVVAAEIVVGCVVLAAFNETGADRFLLRSNENCCCSTEKGMVVHAKGRELLGSQATA